MGQLFELRKQCKKRPSDGSNLRLFIKHSHKRSQKYLSMGSCLLRAQLLLRFRWNKMHNLAAVGGPTVGLVMGIQH